MDVHGAWAASFPGTVKGIIDAQSWIGSLACEQRFPEDVSVSIQVCVEELFANLVRHGGGVWTDEPPGLAGPATTLRMSIDVAIADDAVIVVLEDNGTPFDVAAAQPKPVEHAIAAVTPGGLGIQLIKDRSNDVQYAYVDGLNRTTLKFLWPQSLLPLL